jgi:hypothetical protein
VALTNCGWVELSNSVYPRQSMEPGFPTYPATALVSATRQATTQTIFNILPSSHAEKIDNANEEIE